MKNLHLGDEMIYEIGEDVKKTLENNCDEYEIYIEDRKTLQIDSLKQDLNFAKEELDLGVGIRVLKDNKQGFAYTSNINKLEQTAKKAIENTKLGKKDENYAFSEVEKVRDVKNICDSKFDDLTLDETCDFLNSAIDRIVDNKCQVTGVELYASKEKTLILNSNGVSIEDNQTGYGVSASVTVEDATKIATAYNSESSRFFDIDPYKLVDEICDIVKKSLNTQSISTGDYSVVLDYYASVGLLQTFLSAFNGENVYRGRSILKDKIGTEIANPNLTLVDNPLLENAMNSSKCDGEGSVSKKTELIKNGVLNSFIYDIYTSNITDSENTSNALRSNYITTPQISPTNLEFKFSENLDLEDVKNGVLIRSVLGAHTANPISGDFSVEASNIFKIEDGEIITPITKAMISGNIFEIMKNIEGLKSDIKQYGAYRVPKLLAHNLRVVGE